MAWRWHPWSVPAPESFPTSSGSLPSSGVIFGFVARGQIRRTNGVQGGGGLALAGIIVGFSLIALFILGVALIVAVAHSTTCTTFNYSTNCTSN